jgi:hypothetical protein
MSITPKQIGIDFDSTLVYNCSPYIGGEVPGAVRVLKRLQKAGHILILYTMRVDELLNAALKWAKDRDLEFTYINRNEMYETGSRKVYFHCLIDDKACGIPLVRHPHDENRKPFVDWLQVETWLEENGYL